MNSKMLDNIDVKIIKSLLADARTNFSDIAKKCGVSSTAIHNRYEKLKDSGVIVGSTITVDFRAFDYDCFASFFIKLDPKQKDRFAEYLKKLQPIIHFDPLKEYNTHVIVGVKRFSTIDRIKEMIRSHPAVLEIKTSIWTEWDFFPENLSIINYPE